MENEFASCDKHLSNERSESPLIWLDQGLPVDAIYLDFRKAFDFVPIERLLAKTKSYGINGKLLQWIKSFLTGWQQWVCVNSAKSSWAAVTSGVPQGSVLGPVLFTIFGNDMPEVISCNLKLFADDTKIYCPVRNTNDCEQLQHDLTNLQKWAVKWQLCFHPDKCTVIRIGTGHPEFTYSMTDNTRLVPLATSPHEKDLGVIVDSELNFENHIAAIVSKAKQIAGLMWRSFEYVDNDVFSLLYKSMIRLHLKYAAPVWSPYMWKSAEQIEKVQRRATKRIPGLCSGVTNVSQR